MYQSKINSTIVIDKKTGKAKLEEIGVSVGGYKNRRKSREAKKAYNSDKKMKTEYKNDDWPKGLHDYLLEEYFNVLQYFKIIKNRRQK